VRGSIVSLFDLYDFLKRFFDIVGAVEFKDDLIDPSGLFLLLCVKSKYLLNIVSFLEFSLDIL
jgi:hypothetical protein